MEVKRYEVRGVPKGGTVTLVLFSCTHFGHTGIDLKRLRREIEKVENDPFARWGHLGDAGEFIIANDKRWQMDALDKDYHIDAPMDLQVDKTVEVFRPIKRKGVGFVMGNHEDRYLLTAESNPGRRIAVGLGIEFLGYTALVRFDLVTRTGEVWSPEVFLTHGYGCQAKTLQGQQAYLKKISAPFDCDAAAMGHVHRRSADNNEVFLSSNEDGDDVVEYQRHYAIAGTFMKTYFVRGDGGAGYGEKHHYPPSALGCASIEFHMGDHLIRAKDYWA
jgi:predicted phosphodiesterase